MTTELCKRLKLSSGESLSQLFQKSFDEPTAVMKPFDLHMFEKRADSGNEALLFCAGEETSRADDVQAPSCSLVKEQFTGCNFFRQGNGFDFPWIKQGYKLSQSEESCY